MKKFRFRLEKILQLKAHAEKEKQKLLALSSQKVSDQQKMLAEIDCEREDNKNQQRFHMVGKIDPNMMTIFSRYYLRLKRNELVGNEMLKVHLKNEDEKRRHLVEATRAKKVYEKLKERLFESYQRETDRLLQKEQDELAARMIQHKKSSQSGKGAA